MKPEREAQLNIAQESFTVGYGFFLWKASVTKVDYISLWTQRKITHAESFIKGLSALTKPPTEVYRLRLFLHARQVL